MKGGFRHPGAAFYYPGIRAMVRLTIADNLTYANFLRVFAM
jgi:hypothetical protein